MRFMMYCRLLATSLFIALNVPAHAQEYPAQLVRMIVPFPPTGTSDILARLIAPKLSDRWKVAVIIENRPGAAGNIGMDLVAKAPKDREICGAHPGIEARRGGAAGATLKHS